MLIQSDFERHGFFLQDVKSTSKFYIRPTGAFFKDIELEVVKSHKRTNKINLYIGKQFLTSEVMWSPEQLRQFLLLHKVI